VTAPTQEEVRRIGAIASPALRNLEITYAYSRLAAATAERTGPGANWCTFATWASRQAGRTIRGEDLEDQLRARLLAPRELLRPLTSLWRWLLRRGLLDPSSRLGRIVGRLHTPFDAFELAGDAVARGNKKVFEEIGFEFARFLERVPPGDDAALDAFLRDVPEELRASFTRYHHDRDPQSLLLANLEIGLHEQTRLQPEIGEALDAPYKTVLPIIGPQKLASRLARELITANLMVLTLPGRVLALGANLPDPFPDDLRTPADPALVALLARFEPPPGTVDDCGAHDWSELAQRMHYIAHLFRAFHGTHTLSDAPFTSAQVELILAGSLPDGEL
jgi:hypothetical protein